MQRTYAKSAPAWSKKLLTAAAVYNLAWGVAVIVAPTALFRWAGIEEPRYPQIWQCVGMIVGVYGIGYWIAAHDPFRHWPIVLVGLLGKVFGPIGFLGAAMAGDLPWVWGVTIVSNDLIWWIPFASILYLAFRYNTDTSRSVTPIEFDDAIRNIRSQRNASLFEISSEAPTLVVFLRHGGCIFCRESLFDLARHQAKLQRAGVNSAIVHMGSAMDGTLMLQKYDLKNVHQFSDPQCFLYRAFGLPRGKMAELFAPRVLLRGIRAASAGHGIGKLSGDGFRMPGAFLLRDGKIIAEHRASSAADHPDYVTLLSKVGVDTSDSTQQISELAGSATMLA